MPAQPLPLPSPEEWRRLLSLQYKEQEDRRILEHYLRGWCRRRDRPSAALYRPSDDGYRLQLRVGSGFPEELNGEIGEGLSQIELPSALILHRGEPASDDAEDPALWLIAAGAQISRLKEEIHRHSFEAKFRGVELEALYDVGLAIASTLDLEELGEEVLLRAVSLLDARRGALYLVENATYRLNRSIGGAALEAVPVADPEIRRVLHGEGRGPEGLLPGASHILAVAVEIDGQERGILAVGDKESRRGVGPFPATDRRTLALFANQAAIALENAKLHRLALEKERLEREMELAAEIQSQILPKTRPEIRGFEVLGWNRPARQVGGDYYDIHSPVEGRWSVAVGDVTGKGVPAALLVSTLHSTLRLLSDRLEVGPPLAERLNHHVHESSSANKFITLFLASLDASSSRLTYLNAGHNPGLLLRSGTEVEELPSGGLPLGLLERVSYETRCLELEPGDLLCLYSDGITECEGEGEEEFGLERLVELLQRHRAQPLEAVVEWIERAVTEFAGDRPQGDDQTVVLLRRRPSP